MIYQLNGSRKTMASMSESGRANPLAILPIPITACTAGSGARFRSMKSIKSCRFWSVAEVVIILSLDFALTPGCPTDHTGGDWREKSSQTETCHDSEPAPKRAHEAPCRPLQAVL